MADSNIGWTDKVWNPTVGCSRMSAGCENCYAETFANRLEGMGQSRYKGLTVIGKHGARWTGEVRQVPEVLAAPLGWRKGRRIFVNSMSDLFHEAVPFEYVAAVFGVMAACPQHTFQVLTKRPERAVEFFEWLDGSRPTWMTGATPCDWRVHFVADVAHGVTKYDGACGPLPESWPLPNVHLGVSCEDRETAEERIPLLLQCPAAMRWISAEPLLGQVRLDRPLLVCGSCQSADVVRHDQPEKALTPGDWLPKDQAKVTWRPQALRGADQRTLDWVVVGGESGAGHRLADPAWVDLVVAQCVGAGVPVYVKQDSGPKPGKQGRLSAATWAHKEFPL